ncbi:MAG: hypothetical protein EXS17_06820 [Phycisphaerales bacterium]|nr:hypothetical protein [Phycisphaerales bacterium]
MIAQARQEAKARRRPRFGALFLAVALACLVGLIVLARELHATVVGIPTSDLPAAGETTLLLGLVILGSWLAGRLVRKIALPPITGQLLFGMLIGPGLWEWLRRPELALITPAQLTSLHGAEVLAVVMIGLVAGSEIDSSFVRARLRAIVMLALGQVTVIVATVGCVAYWFFRSPAHAVIFATLAATCSSAVSVALLREMRHPTAFARLLLATTVTKDLVLVVAFSVVLFTVATTTNAGGHAWHWIVLHVAGSVGIGCLLAIPLRLALRQIEERMIAVVLVVAVLIVILCEITDTAPLITALTLGYTARAIAPVGSASFFATARRLFLPVCCVFFAAAGAHIECAALFANWGVVLALSSSRLVAVWIGATVAARAAGLPAAMQRWAWAGFVPQAGISLALAAQVLIAFPGQAWARNLVAIMIACITLNEVIGPILMRIALRRVPDSA